MPAMLCRVGAAACSSLLTTVARFGLRGLPCSGRMALQCRGPGRQEVGRGDWKFPLGSASVVVSLLF